MVQSRTANHERLSSYSMATHLRVHAQLRFSRTARVHKLDVFNVWETASRRTSNIIVNTLAISKFATSLNPLTELKGF